MMISEIQAHTHIHRHTHTDTQTHKHTQVYIDRSRIAYTTKHISIFKKMRNFSVFLQSSLSIFHKIKTGTCVCASLNTGSKNANFREKVKQVSRILTQ